MFDRRFARSLARAYDLFELAFWSAAVLLLAASLLAFAMRPASHTYYGSDTGLCDSGCGDFR
jgi:hypothetical protein